MGLLSFAVQTVVMETILSITDKYKICKLGKHTRKKCKQSDNERTQYVNKALAKRTSVSLVVQQYKITKLSKHMGKTCKQSDSERTKVVNKQ